MIIQVYDGGYSTKSKDMLKHEVNSEDPKVIAATLRAIADSLDPKKSTYRSSNPLENFLAPKLGGTT